MTSEPTDRIDLRGIIVHIDDVHQEPIPVEAGTVHLLPVGSDSVADSAAAYPVADGVFGGAAPSGNWTVCHEEDSGFFDCAPVVISMAGPAVDLLVELGDGSTGASIVS